MNNKKHQHITLTATKEVYLQLQPGQNFALRYEIKQRVRADGTGTLYLATEKTSGELLEIQVLYPRR